MRFAKIFFIFLILGIGISLFFSHPALAQGLFIRGDINYDGVVDTVDLRLVLPSIDADCIARHDVNGDGDLSSADRDYLRNYLFFGGPPPPHPFPNCGFDTTPPFISCTISGCCTLTTQCYDKIDNDGDGFTDYPDDICCTNACDTLETAGGGTQCSDGLDNDGDGFVDLGDCSCSDSCDNSEDYVDQCRDGMDNDGDGFIDLADCGCSDSCYYSEYPVDQCHDGIDNDGDGLIDLADPLCCNACDYSESYSYKPCDVDGSGTWSLTDIIKLVGMVYKGGAKPSPLCRADCNASGSSPTLPDIVYLVNKVFKGGPNPLPVGECCLP